MPGRTVQTKSSAVLIIFSPAAKRSLTAVMNALLLVSLIGFDK